jgi:AraC-like DNA-binding protein
MTDASPDLAPYALCPAGTDEAVCFWRPVGLPELDCLSAHFTTHRYPLHRHDSYVIAVIEAGAEALSARGVRWRAAPGQIVLLNPDELHDGQAAGPAFRYRVFYPSPGLLRAAATDLSDGADRPAPGFGPVIVDDPALARCLLAAHVASKDEPDALARDSALTSALAALLRRHADPRPLPRAGAEQRRIARVTAMMRAEPERPFALEDLAAAAGLSRFHFLRVFSKATGQTPHAFLVNQRVNRAQEMLRAGERPAEVAVACGFADQPHLTRLFRRIVGVTPGQYARAVCH